MATKQWLKKTMVTKQWQKGNFDKKDNGDREQWQTKRLTTKTILKEDNGTKDKQRKTLIKDNAAKSNGTKQ